MRVVCLLPARDAAAHLPAWFESVSRFADAVVALDDGSVDGTAELLDAHPMVEVLLRNPVRRDFAGWDDSQNRNRLLSAARSRRPDFVISIDADERLSPRDGDALRHFIEHDARPGIAYGFPVVQMVDDVDHFDGIESDAYRLFAYREHHRFPEHRLHFPPVPTAIPRHRWLVTNLRIQHLGGLTPELRRARREKYREADPTQEWEDYAYLEAPPSRKRVFRERRPGCPVILRSRFGWDPSETEPEMDWPVLSIVVIIDDAAADEMIPLVRAIDTQGLRHDSEVIVLAHGAGAADDVARLRPGSTVIEIPMDTTPGAARNRGLRVARGDYVVFFDAPADLAPGALAALVETHDAGNGYVAGRVANRSRSAHGWAEYLDGPGSGSFARAPLLATGGFDERLASGVDAAARDRVLRAGQHPAESPLITYRFSTAVATRAGHLRTAFERGRASAATPLPRNDGHLLVEQDAPRCDPRVRALRVAGMAAARVGAWLGAAETWSRSRRR